MFMQLRNVSRSPVSALIVGFGLLAASSVRGGGSPEHTLLLADPTRPDAMYVANYYRAARDVPDENVLYIDPGAANYPTFVDQNLDMLFGTLAQRGLSDHIDVLLLMPSDSFYIPAPGLVSDNCSPVTRFSISSAYITAFIADQVLGGVSVELINRYYRGGAAVYYFSSNIRYAGGFPATPPNGKQYFLAALIGYTGERGNTVDEILANIDRSVAVDGTRPAGTFYFMETNDSARSDPRDGAFDNAVSLIQAEGWGAEHLFAVLPAGRHDCLGIMTGAANPAIDTTDMTILPGAFCDHLTSFAATFDTSSQTKLSRWIANGASGSHGTVQEPCNYPGKFPHPRVHVYYVRGLSLGESVFRSLRYVPFQGLIYGDPLTRPFAYLPSVDVPDAPTQPVSGTVTLTPTATAANPNAGIDTLALIIDGRIVDTIVPGGAFSVDTTTLADGWHDVRVLAYDDSDARNVGRWVGSMEVNNRGRSVAVTPSATNGDLATAFDFDILAAGGAVQEVRLWHNGRIVAAAAGNSATLRVFGQTLGAGPARVFAEALFSDGRRVRSAPVLMDIVFDPGAPTGDGPLAYGYARRVDPSAPAVIELPAAWDDSSLAASYSILTVPTQASIVHQSDWPYVLLRPDPAAAGLDALTFRVTLPGGASAEATITIDYGQPCPADLDGDDSIGLSDLAVLLSNFGMTSGAQPADGDLDGDGDVDLTDLAGLLAVFGTPCP